MQLIQFVQYVISSLIAWLSILHTRGLFIQCNHCTEHVYIFPLFSTEFSVHNADSSVLSGAHFCKKSYCIYSRNRNFYIECSLTFTRKHFRVKGTSKMSVHKILTKAQLVGSRRKKYSNVYV